jgi:hypothetical protein
MNSYLPGRLELSEEKEVSELGAVVAPWAAHQPINMRSSLVIEIEPYQHKATWVNTSRGSVLTDGREL